MRAQIQDAIRKALKPFSDLPLDLTRDERDSIAGYVAEALSRLLQPERWGYVKINPEQQALLFEDIILGAKPYQTLRVWAAALKHIKHGTNELMASRARLSEETGIAPREVSRSLSRLVEIGVFRRIGRGLYKLNPHVAQQGTRIDRTSFTPLCHVATKEDAHV